MVQVTIEPEVLREGIKPFKDDVKLCISKDGILIKGTVEVKTEEYTDGFVKRKEAKEIIQKIPAENILGLTADTSFCCEISPNILRHITSIRGGKEFKKAWIEIKDVDGSIEFKQKIVKDGAPSEIERIFTQRCIL